MEYLKIVLAAVFVSNFVLALFLGLCPFIGVSKKLDNAVGMGLAVIFVMTMASFVTYTLYEHSCVHRGHSQSGPVCGDGASEERSRPVPGAGDLPAPHHHQLCGAGGHAVERQQVSF